MAAIKKGADLEKMKPLLKISGAVLCVLMLRVWETVQAQRLERELRGLREETDRLAYDNGRLQMQIHQYVAPSHLEALAKKDFAMVPVDTKHRIGIQP